jgi:hypothetical protein
MGITGRPKSQNPKSVMASLRITERERDLLMLTHGTVNAGLRAALDKMLTQPVRSEPTASVMQGNKVDRGVVDEATAEMADLAVNIPPRLVVIPDMEVTMPAGGGGGTVIIDSLDYPAGRGKSSRHSHKPANLVSERFEGGVKYETWMCLCGKTLPERGRAVK